MVFGCRWSIIDFNFYKVCELIEENTEFESSHSAESMSVSETDSDEEQIFQMIHFWKQSDQMLTWSL